MFYVNKVSKHLNKTKKTDIISTKILKKIYANAISNNQIVICIRNIFQL